MTTGVRSVGDIAYDPDLVLSACTVALYMAKIPCNIFKHGKTKDIPLPVLLVSTAAFRMPSAEILLRTDDISNNFRGGQWNEN